MAYFTNDLLFIKGLQNPLNGHTVDQNGKKIQAILCYDQKDILLKVGDEVNLSTNTSTLSFISTSIQGIINTNFSAIRNSLQIDEKTFQRYSEGKVDSLISQNWTSQPNSFRSYYSINSNRILYDLFGTAGQVTVKIGEEFFSISNNEDHLVIRNDSHIEYERFSEIRYAILVAIGFLSGKFIQDYVYTFQGEEKEIIYRYDRLKRGTSSIYHPVTINAFAYSHMLGNNVAEKIYKSKILQPINAKQLSKLVTGIIDHNQLLYAVVLFNEANGNGNSLLIKNNCLFIVLEVLRKFFYEEFKDEILKGYTSKSNIEKFVCVFEQITSVSDDERNTLSQRNVFMHGDIKDIEGAEMLSLMQKQITFIYKCVLSYIDFDGYIIDHFAIRSQQGNMAFIKLDRAKHATK